MAIIITTMNKLPEHCYECPCHDGESGYCQADKEQRFSDYRPYWCPLKEIVPCKECKRYYANGGNCDQILADWFCADGKKEGNDT